MTDLALLELTELDRLVWSRLPEAFEPKVRRWDTPTAMAVELEPEKTVRTAMQDCIDRHLIDVADGRTKRLMIFCPPQEGKSQKVSRRFPAWLLSHDPTLRIGIVSFEQERATRWGRDIKRDVETHPTLGIHLRADSKAAGRWHTEQGGGVYCAGIGAALTGEPLDVLIIDDPVKGRKEAESSTYRDAAWDWWESVGSTRLSTRGVAVLMMCMTGDTPVLLPDGAEKPLRDIRPGDEVATYEGGRLTTSTVMNWAHQGLDDLICIRMKSGRVVRANARHPFLTIDANGEESWLRTDQIQPGVRILTATGGSGAGSPAPLTDVTRQRGARGCATPTTTRLSGRPATARLRSMLRRVAKLASSIVTDSPTKRSTSSSTSRVGTAPSADSRRRAVTPEPTGTGSCASTMTTTPERYADCSATTATSPSDTGSHPQLSGLPLTTWSVTPDEVVAVEPCGREDVFDLQIARTENFIANGLVSHNTRWHEDDLAGRLLAHEPGQWTVLRIPAIAEDADPLGRPPGEELKSVQKRPPGYFKKLEQVRSPYVWLSVYQQAPSAAEGLIFKRIWWRYWTPARGNGESVSIAGKVHSLADAWRFATVDLAASTRTSADYTVISAWAKLISGDLVLLDRVRARIGEMDHFENALPLVQRWKLDTVFVEASQLGMTLVKQATQSGVPISPVQAETDKLSRALPASAWCKAGRIWLPSGAWWLDTWVSEHASFPSATHDDQVDTTAYAVRVAVTQWAPPPRPPEPRVERRRDPIDAAFGGPTDVDLMGVAL